MLSAAFTIEKLAGSIKRNARRKNFVIKRIGDHRQKKLLNS